MRSSLSIRHALSLVLLVGSLTGCGGRPDSLVVVEVSGLLPRITELFVTMKLDDVAAKNTMPITETGSSAFVVYQQMERFGIEVPVNTQRIEVDIKGFDTARETVRQGQGSLELSQGHDLSIELVAP
ncbi:MAG: hypothetical protein U0745_16350 [Polyangia bacterium]|jgi:hypothetical protein